MQNETGYNEFSYSIWSLQRKPFNTKDTMRVVFLANLLANVLTNEWYKN